MNNKVPERLYLHKEYKLHNGRYIDCRSICTERKSKEDIEYIILK